MESTAVYIGITDQSREGKWFWLNGNLYNSADFAWAVHDNYDTTEGSDGPDDNCAIMSFAYNNENDLRVWDIPCSQNRRGLCEKLISN